MCEKSEEEDERCRFFYFVLCPLVSPKCEKGKVVPAREKRETREEVEATSTDE
jgi:hypothetical protein